jgi:hypothetical protein
MPVEEGEIEQATLEGKYLITRKGKWIWVSLILTQKPILITREILKSFSKRFESIFKQELGNLYTQLEGDISVFAQGSGGKDLEDLINQEFHLYYSQPYKPGSHKGMKLTPELKKTYHTAKNLSHKVKNHLLLKDLLSKVKKALDFDETMAINVIHKLVESKILLPISEPRIKKDFLHH